MKASFGNPVTYTLENTAGLVLEVGELNRGNGGAIRIWVPLGGEAQQWRFEPAANGCYRIRNAFSGKLLDVAMQGTENGTGVHQWEDTGADSQLWSVVPARGPGGGFKVCNVMSGKYLDIAGMVDAGGVGVQIWDGKKGQAQRWKITAQNETAAKNPRGRKAIMKK